MFYQCKMGQNTLEDVVDKFNIRELIEFERYCRDYKLWDEMRPLYHDDAKIVVSWMTGTPDEFVAGSKRMNASKAPAKHKVFDTVIWKNGNRAVAECITAIQIRCPMGDDTVDMSTHTRLHYHVEKRDGVYRATKSSMQMIPLSLSRSSLVSRNTSGLSNGTLCRTWRQHSPQQVQ